MAKVWTTRNRALVVGAAMATLFTAYSYRLIQLYEDGRLAAQGELPKMRNIMDRDLTLYAHRGTIFDRHNEVLASEVRVSRVVADSSLVTDIRSVMDERERQKLINERIDEVAGLLEEHLGMDRDVARAQLSSRKRYLILARKAPQDKALALVRALHERRIPGIYLEHDWERVYPNGAVLAEVIGYTNHEHQGIAGLEQSADTLLKGINGSRKYKTDLSGRELIDFRREETAPKDGYSLRLTLDLGAQAIVDRELDRLAAKYRPEKASIIIMNPHTGDVIAMGNRPTFDLRKWKDADPKHRRNPAVMDMYEPGSTFKIVAAAAALNEGLAGPETSIFCHNGLFLYKGTELKDHHGYGDLTVTNIIAKSSNIGAAKLALQLGANRYHGYIEKFGFGQRTGIRLPAESGGISMPVSKWNNMSITRVPMGHGIAVTPLQMVSAMSVIANGGMLLEPRVVEAIVNEAGEVTEPLPVKAKHRVIKAEVARQMRQMLEKTTQKGGTATQAAVEGFTVAGKTGTAQKVREGRAGYMKGKYVVSFLGFMPADDPAFVGIVVVDAPHAVEAEAYGGTIAAPSFANVAKELAVYMDLEPDVVPLAGKGSDKAGSKNNARVVLNAP